MSRKNLRQAVSKYALIAVCIFFISYGGLLTHLFELDFERFFNYPLEQDVQQYVFKFDNAKRPEVPPTNYYNNTFIHKPTGKCSELDAGGHGHDLTILIKSAMDNVQRRAAIRRTWGYEQRFSDVTVRRVFLLGVSSSDAAAAYQMRIDKEVADNNDIVQASFVDAYFNNTIKTVTGMRWAVEHCPHTGYFMFVDDDYFVSVKNVLKFLAHPTIYPDVIERRAAGANNNSNTEKSLLGAEKEALFAGFVMQTAPHRHKSSKWFVSLQEYPFDMWPPYVTAGAFVLSREALFQLYYVSLYTRHFRFDDVFLGIVALRARIKLTHCPRFYFHRPKYSGPESYRYTVASHGFDDPTEMERVWNECRSAGYA